MTGPAGGGFIFDPATIHRAPADKPHPARDVVIVDVSPVVKSDLKIPPRERVCPMPSWKTEAVNSIYEYPEKGHGPITTDLLKKNNGKKLWDEHFNRLRSQFASEEEYYETLLTTTGDGNNTN